MNKPNLLATTFAVVYVVYAAAVALCSDRTLEGSTPWFYGLN
jgi:hypothetical protein